MQKQNRVEREVQQLAEELLANTPYTLYDLEFVKEGSDRVLRLFIDSKDGVDLNGCEEVSRLLEEPLDRLDPISEAYLLEVSSPGVERRLRTMEHFQQAVGETILVKCYAPIDGSRKFVGTLLSVDAEQVTVACDGADQRIPFENLAHAHISVF